MRLRQIAFGVVLVFVLTIAPVIAVSATPTPVSSWQRKASSSWVFEDPGDPLSARATAAITGPDFGVSTFDGAVQDLLTTEGLALKSQVRLEPIEAWRRLYGSDLRAALVDADINGTPATLFMTVKRRKNSDIYEMYVVMMPTSTFRAWGGVTWLMVDAGLLPDTKLYAPKRAKQIAFAPYAKQLSLFEKAADLRVNLLAKQMQSLMLNQMLVTQMLELNLDLMFGELAVSPVAN